METINLGKFTEKGKEVILEKQENGCIICISHSKDNCSYTRIKYNNKMDRLYRVLYEKEYGTIPKGMVIRHKCDNPSCVNIQHLEVGTQKDNVKDMVQRGRAKYGCEEMKSYGEKNGAHKLTQEEVKEIYLDKTLSTYRLAEKFNVSRAAISYIKNKNTWKAFTDTLD